MLFVFLSEGLRCARSFLSCKAAREHQYLSWRSEESPAVDDIDRHLLLMWFAIDARRNRWPSMRRFPKGGQERRPRILGPHRSYLVRLTWRRVRGRVTN